MRESEEDDETDFLSFCGSEGLDSIGANSLLPYDDDDELWLDDELCCSMSCGSARVFRSYVNSFSGSVMYCNSDCSRLK